MPKILECDRCLYCAHDYHLVCALHPTSVENGNCPDFNPDPNLKDKRYQDFIGLVAQVEPNAEEQWQRSKTKYFL